MKSLVRRHRVRAAVSAGLAIGTAVLAAPLTAGAADLNAVNHAARIASGVGAGTAVPSLGVGAVLQTLVGLAVVIGLVFACAWLARRFGWQPSARGNIVRTIGGVSLGGKERVAVVEIGDTWLVLGAAPGSVRLLHTLPAGSVSVSVTGDVNATQAGADGSGISADADAEADADADADAAAQQSTFGSRFRAALGSEAKKRFSRPSGGGK